MSRFFKPLIIGLIALIALLAAFQAGRFVGERRAMYSFRWGQNYHRMFGGPPHGFFGDDQGRGYMDAHGIFGSILTIDRTTLIIKDKDETEKTVRISPDTVIRRNQESIHLSDVSSTDSVIVIGEPNDDGEIEAKLIRVVPRMDPPPQR